LREPVTSHRGKISRTSILVAAARAFGSRDPDPTVRNPDWLAEEMLGPNELSLIQGHPLRSALAQDYVEACRDTEVAGLTMMMLVRTRFIDERLVTAVRSGTSQIVILGAGFDTRAYRFHELLRQSVVFELDYPAMLDLKKQRVEAVIGALQSHVIYAPIDFDTDRIGVVLGKVGWRPQDRTFFSWEGVSMYVSGAGVRETLRTIAATSAPGSSLVMDYAPLSLVEFFEKHPDVPRARQLTSWGERWIFGIPDGQECEFFMEMGFDQIRFLQVNGAEAVARYLRRQDGRVFDAISAAPTGMPLQNASAAISRGTTKVGLYSLAEAIVPDLSICKKGR
jgi:methyltransferase (TIGR00027 family)